MTDFTKSARRSTMIGSLALIALCGLAALPNLSYARPNGVTVVITNNSSRGIRNVFFSPVDNDNWGDNQLIRVVTPGQNATVTAADCPGSQIKLIAEDTDGCFISVVVTCGGNVDWTITNGSARDCGN